MKTGEALSGLSCHLVSNKEYRPEKISCLSVPQIFYHSRFWDFPAVPNLKSIYLSTMYQIQQSILSNF